VENVSNSSFITLFGKGNLQHWDGALRKVLCNLIVIVYSQKNHK